MRKFVFGGLTVDYLNFVCSQKPKKTVRNFSDKQLSYSGVLTSNSCSRPLQVPVSRSLIRTTDDSMILSTVCKLPAKGLKRGRKLVHYVEQGEYDTALYYGVSLFPYLLMVGSIGALVISVVSSTPVHFHTSSLLLFIASQLANKSLNRILKAKIAQPRPDHDTINKHRSAGMPSYHAQISFFAATCLTWKVRNSNHGFDCLYYQVGAFLMAILVSLTRLQLHRHTINQVVVGAILGLVLGVGYCTSFMS